MTDPFGAHYVFASSAGVFEFKDGVGTAISWSREAEKTESGMNGSPNCESKPDTSNES